MKLTATGVKQAKVKAKPYKLTDGHSLYLFVNGKGKYWRYDYAAGGKRKTLSLGIYPEVSLGEARKRHQQARENLANGIDPSLLKRTRKNNQQIDATNSFNVIASEWFEVKMAGKSKKHLDRCRNILDKDLGPAIGSQPITTIKAPDVLAALRKIELRGVDASRARSTASQIFRYAIASGRCEVDPARDLNNALRTKTVTHHASITEPEAVSSLMKAIQNYEGTFVVKSALYFSALVFQRPGEIRNAEWDEISWEKKQWVIPASKMKSKREHIVPLAAQAIKVLKSVQELTGNGKYIFPSARGKSRPLSDNAIRTALRALGYANDEMTPHGFRAMARTILDEILNYRVDWIEHQLAHSVRDATGRAYNRTSHLEDRHFMMQDWADYLDELTENA